MLSTVFSVVFLVMRMCGTVFTSLMYQSSQRRRASRCQDLLYTLNTQRDRSHMTPQERAASPDRSGSAPLHPTQPSALSSYLPRNNWDVRASRENIQHQQLSTNAISTEHIPTELLAE